MDILETLFRMMPLVVFYLYAMSGLTQSTDDEYIKWSEDIVKVKEGGNVRLFCTSGGMTMFDVIRLTRNFDSSGGSNAMSDIRLKDYGDEILYDEDVDDDGGFDESFTLVDNTDVKTPIDRISRYSFQFERNATFGTMHFSITGVQPKDSGVISCFKLKRDSAVVRTRIVVEERSAEGRFVAILKRSDDVIVQPRNSTELLLNTDLHSGFGCMVVSYNDISDHMTFDLNLDGRRVHDVIYKENLKKVVPSVKDIPYLQYRYIALVQSPDLLADDGKELECRLYNSPLDVIFRNKLKVQYPPIIKSCSRDSQSKKGQYSLACNVLSQTAFTVKVTSGDVYTEVKHSLVEQAISMHEVKINVTIFEAMDNQMIMFHLANSFGMRTKTFDLSREIYESEEEIVKQKNVKVHSKGKDDSEYQLSAETYKALESASAAHSIHEHHLIIVPILVIFRFCVINEN